MFKKFIIYFLYGWFTPFRTLHSYRNHPLSTKRTPKKSGGNVSNIYLMRRNINVKAEIEKNNAFIKFIKNPSALAFNVRASKALRVKNMVYMPDAVQIILYPFIVNERHEFYPCSVAVAYSVPYSHWISFFFNLFSFISLRISNERSKIFRKRK